MPDFIYAYAEHTSKPGFHVPERDLERYEELETSPDVVRVELTTEAAARYDAMGTSFGWRVAELIRNCLGISEEDEQEETDAELGERIGRAIARDVLAQNMPREWTGLDPQDADQIPDGADAEAVERHARAAYLAAIAEHEA